ncbi:putative oxysterol binding protein [Stachybotrys elegans]|uniref:Oxysterol binding protein n=1 Tax=Stachybotrys elegans TaxID=80388 RepID=A0A8K0T2M8_9HYPO|nr:putative oxysterol binding protein [Stachybotrys elegans]
MAGIEQLEVHSKSYVVRWVKVDEGNTLSWSVQPHKKSINFGIVKHPGSGATNIASLATDEIESPGAHTHGSNDGKGNRFPKKETTAQDLLANKGFIPIKWAGKCEADKVSIGTYDVQPGQAGMYGLVFDNTFSRQTSKTATFVILTYPTDAPPQSANHMPNLQAPGSRGNDGLRRKPSSSHMSAMAASSVDSLHSHNIGARQGSVQGASENGQNGNYHVGNLSKRRRKKGQGYARRFFSLDYSTCTLSYYYNRNSSALRGAIPLSLAAISADEKRREISIDSGAEVWHLRAPGQKEFQDWARALEKASRVARGMGASESESKPSLKTQTSKPQLNLPAHHGEDTEWHQVETLVSRVVGTRDALRRLTKEVAAQPQPQPRVSTPNSTQFLSPAGSGHDEGDGYFPTPNNERKPFWRRKSSAAMTNPATIQSSIASAASVGSPGISATPAGSTNRLTKRNSRGPDREENSLHDHCQALLTDLDSVVAEFVQLINNSKRRRMSTTSALGAPRRSIDTVSTADEFFDAEDETQGVVKIDASEGETPESDADEQSFHDSSSISSEEEEEAVAPGGLRDLFPAKPKSLVPLPIGTPVARRATVPPAAAPPPSLVAFARKNVGKDFSTISMPVSSNEPLSFLQKVAEQLEYAQLLDQAIKHRSPTERLLYVAAFAISNFSNGRHKERAIRKPFNPLLGETFELVRSDKETPGNFRVLVEKVQHRPVKLAMHADSANWSFSQAAAPGQKFWGRSAEITTDGRVRIVLRLPDGSDELYSWNIATMFLRNVVMGEKYVEPVGTMHVVNESTGHKAVVEFKNKGGMFGGRAEDVHVDTFDPNGNNTGSGLQGTWTTALRTVDPGKGNGEEIWRAGKLVDDAAQRYGMTTFAASLNEITELEKGKLPSTDSRLRPDQRLAEEGQLDDAEEWKVKLEEAQRTRRREMEESGVDYKPRWFVKADATPDGEEVWKLKTGKDGYWEERAKGNWSNVPDIFSASG